MCERRSPQSSLNRRSWMAVSPEAAESSLTGLTGLPFFTLVVEK
jgi:hypothetical protein